jgi:hypothetical protein
MDPSHELESLRQLQSEAKAVLVRLDRNEYIDQTEADQLLKQIAQQKACVQTKRADADEELRRMIDGRVGDNPVRQPATVAGTDLAAALLKAGWNLKTQPVAIVDSKHALELKTGSLDGGSAPWTPCSRGSPRRRSASMRGACTRG